MSALAQPPSHVSAQRLGHPHDRAQSRALSTRDLTSGYRNVPVVRSVNVDIPPGKITVIVGANACGKSTLLKTMARIIPTISGATVLDGHAITAIPTKELARQLGMLPQHPLAPEGITVADLVGRGRHPHQRLFRAWSGEDAQIVAESLEATGIADLAQRSIDELSGGQRQRVWIAMALAQRTDVLLLDEPTTFLDLTHQVEVLDLLTDVNRERGTTVVMVLHDINLAARYADHIIAMRNGQVEAEGAPREVVTEHLVYSVLGLRAQVIADPVSGTPLIVPIGRHHAAGGEAQFALKGVPQEGFGND